MWEMNPRSCLLALTLAGCGVPGTWFELELDGESYDFINDDRVDEGSYPFYSSSGITQELQATQPADRFGGVAPYLSYSLGSRIYQDGDSPLAETVGWGVGKVQGDLRLGEEPTQSAIYTLDTWSFTGNKRSPISVEGSVSWAGGAGRFELRSDCSSTINASQGEMLCGGHLGATVDRFSFSEKAAYNYGAGVVNLCPAEVLERFLGPIDALDTAVMELDGTRGLQVSDAARYDCVVTLEGNDLMCGAEVRGVEAEGCTWDAYSIAAPRRNAAPVGQDLNEVWLWVGAKAREGCALETPFCNGDMLFY